MASPSQSGRVLYVSARPVRRLEGGRVRVVSHTEMAESTVPAAASTAEWILVDASVLDEEPPAWFAAVEGRIGLLGSARDDLPEWVHEAELPLFDPNLIPLVTSLVGDVVDDQFDPQAQDTQLTAGEAGSSQTYRAGTVDESEAGTESAALVDDGEIANSLVAMPYPVALVDAKGIIRWTNRRWREFGFENGRRVTDTDVGSDYLAICDAAEDDFSSSAAAALRSVLAGESDGERIEYPCHSDKSDRWYSMDVTPVQGPGPVCAVISHIEITSYKQRINVLDRVLRHNLRNKANIILGHAAALASDRDDETATAATTIGAAARELLSLSEQARKYQEVRISEETPASIDVNGVVDEVTERIRESYPAAVIETSLPPVAFARGSRSVALVIRELVENAVVHNDRDDPWVRIEVTTDNGVSILIADDGPGIPDPDRRLLTGAAVEKPVRHGSQLGVWVVNSLVRSLGGRVDVYDRSPRGSVVTVTLPGATDTDEDNTDHSRATGSADTLV